jgi:Protein of unknown function (DUF3300)
MMKQLLKVVLCGAVLSGTALAGPSISSAYAQAASIQAYSAEQLDALLAPIALYPDALLAQVLMASTFPLQVVSAGRWVDDPANKSLSGDALAKALEPQTWDPSVKSLVPFPSVLALLNSNLRPQLQSRDRLWCLALPCPSACLSATTTRLYIWHRAGGRNRIRHGRCCGRVIVGLGAPRLGHGLCQREY